MWMSRQKDGFTSLWRGGRKSEREKDNELEELIELRISFYTGDRGGRKIKYNEQFSA